MSQDDPQVRFEQEGSCLTAIEITRAQRSPVIAVLQRTLFALGIVVSSYQARARSARLVERIVIERSDVARQVGHHARVGHCPAGLGDDVRVKQPNCRGRRGLRGQRGLSHSQQSEGQSSRPVDRSPRLGRAQIRKRFAQVTRRGEFDRALTAPLRQALTKTGPCGRHCLVLRG